MLKLYYETEAIRVSYDEELQLGKGEWKRSENRDELRSTILHLLEFVKEQGIARWLSDRSHLREAVQQDLQGIIIEFYPQLVDGPLRRMANVVPAVILQHAATERIIRRSGMLGNIIVRDFETVPAAMEWLQLPYEVTDSSGAGNGYGRE